MPHFKTDIHKLKSNITFDKLQGMEFDELKVFIDNMRTEILSMWDSENKPPVIGKKESDIIKSFSQLKNYPVENLFYKDKNYPQFEGLIKNFTKLASPVNQFFPDMLKTRINGRSMYDWFSNKNLSTEFRRILVRTLRFDGMYSYSKCLKTSDYDSFIDWYNNKNGYDFWLEESSDSNCDNVKVFSEDLDRFQDENIITQYHLRNLIVDLRRLSSFNVRYYQKEQKLFPELIQIFRLGLGTVPVNFPPLTARLIYEKFLPENESDSYTVYDMCAGWGGRLLGSLCSKLKIHYVGTDVNSNNFGCYEELGEFYNKNCDGRNTFDIFRDGSEVIGKNKRFQKYKNQLDLAMTSPPYFHREVYSEDKEQSCLKFNNYKDWLNGYLLPTIQTCYEFLKDDRYMIINISDVKMGVKDFIPLEQDTISLAVQNGFRFIGIIGMIMTRMIGLNPSDVKNNIYDSESRTYYKLEPILIFKKESK
tara:strand:- start:1021 stop:2448 length:1428 start_codon:yes stop_codon:yes gene_type:complete